MSKSVIASGMGLAMSIITNLIKAVKDAGGKEEDLHWLSKTESFGTGSRLLKKIGELVARKGEMNPERYNEIAKVTNLYCKYHGEMPAHWVLMELEPDGTIECMPEGITQEGITAFINETGISIDELREWAYMEQARLEAEAQEVSLREIEPDPSDDYLFGTLAKQDPQGGQPQE